MSGADWANSLRLGPIDFVVMTPQLVVGVSRFVASQAEPQIQPSPTDREGPNG